MYSPYESSVIYQMFLRVFTPEGTLTAAEKKLPFLRDLGVDFVYLCPCFVEDDDERPAYWSKRQTDCGFGNPRNPYRIKDYFDVDPEYGSLEDLRRFVQTAHALGLKVLLDLVYFHCGPTAVLIDKDPDFIRRNSDGSPYCGGWNFPRLNFGNPALREYLWDNMEFYVRDFDVDGYRCDVGDMVPVDFWEEGARRIRAVKHDAFLLDEGLKPRWLESPFDAGYRLFWPEHEAVKHVFAGDTPAARLRDIDTVLDVPPGKALIRALETHDTICDYEHEHYELYAGHEAVNAALVFNFCADGIPFLYNGYEIADTGRHSIFSNRFDKGHRAIDWSRADTPDGQDRLRLVKRLTALRHSVPALSKGNLAWRYGMPETVMVFTRRTPGSRIVAAFNAGNRAESAATGLEIHVKEPLLAKGMRAEAATDGRLTLHLEPKAYYLAEFDD